MGNLPKEMVKIGEKPFSNTGVDYFGPYLIKKNREARLSKALTKRYEVIFTCLTARAILIELTGDLSTDSFLLALRRFKFCDLAMVPTLSVQITNSTFALNS